MNSVTTTGSVVIPTGSVIKNKWKTATPRRRVPVCVWLGGFRRGGGQGPSSEDLYSTRFHIALTSRNNANKVD